MTMETRLRETTAAMWLLALANACGGSAASLDGNGDGATGGGTNVGGATTTTGTSTSASAASGNVASGGNASTTLIGAAGGNDIGTAAAGTAATLPSTGNYFVKQGPSSSIDKIDLLFMIDNSLSMGDKQTVLAAAVPQLLRRLTNPDCIDPTGKTPPRSMANATDDCPAGSIREFPPIKDIHIGVVTSSLGAFGGDTCPTIGAQNAAQNDHAWLLGALPRNADKALAPFLSWSAVDPSDYATQLNAKIDEFRVFVNASSELGCGFEMGLEAWYRFLIDPKPPVDVTTVNSAANQRGSVDANILQQRQAFLRPDSLVAVFMLSDENDCSMRDNTYSWVTMTASNGFRMWRGSHACDANPNDPCCYSCMLDSLAASNCKALDPTCRQNEFDARLVAANDDINTRCRQMKKRFGYDFLFPPSRYVAALTQKRICPDQDYGDLDCNCTVAKSKGIACNPGAAVDNPLYVNLNPKVYPSGPQRQGPDAVFLAGLLGIPWQDIAVDPSDNTTLQYKTASELTWDLFAPKPNEDYSTAQLADPLMLESFQPRTGTHPITREALAPPDAGRGANKINGHEWNTANRDVQFACIFSLDVQLTSSASNATRVCDLTQECGADNGSDAYRICARRFDGCSCILTPTGAATPSASDPTQSHSPLCQAADGSYGNKQFFAKAYPGLRQLQVLRGFYEATQSDNAIVGSICPKDLTYANQNTVGYGYNPAVKALVDRVKTRFGGGCLPRSLTVQPDGTVPCSIVEAIDPNANRAWCECETHGRLALSSELKGVIQAGMQRDGICGTGTSYRCDDFCLCQLQQLVANSSDSAIATAASRCLTQPNSEKTTAPPGFCYVDPAQGLGAADVDPRCTGPDQRFIRIVGNTSSVSETMAAPAPGLVYMACTQAASATPAQ